MWLTGGRFTSGHCEEELALRVRSSPFHHSSANTYAYGLLEQISADLHAVIYAGLHVASLERLIPVLVHVCGALSHHVGYGAR